MNPQMWFAIVTFGSPLRDYRKVHSSQADAQHMAASLLGTGTCTKVRVVECQTYAAAYDADISQNHKVVFEV